MKKKTTILAFILLFVSCVMAQPKVKNVIFMIGDGMGLSQIYASATASGIYDYELFQAPYVG